MIVFRHPANDFVPHFARWDWSCHTGMIASVQLFSQEFPCLPLVFSQWADFPPQSKDLHSHCLACNSALSQKWILGSTVISGHWKIQIDTLAGSWQSSYILHRSSADWWYCIQMKQAPLLSLFALARVSRDFFLFFLLNGTKNQTDRSDGKS